MRKLTITVTAAASIASLVALSASAEDRHRDETRNQQQQQSSQRDSRDHGNGNWRGQAQVDTQRWDRSRTDTRNSDRSQTRNYDRSQTRNDGQTRNYDRSQTRNDGQTRNYDRSQTRNYDRGQTRNNDRSYTNRNNDNRNYGDRRNDNRSYNYDRNRSYDHRSNDRSNAYREGVRYDARGRRSFDGEGRVRNFRHENGGYRVWLEGSTYPYWIPEARWRAFPLRLGLSVRLGGWYDPLGYVDVYDVGPYAYGAPVYTTSGQLQGVVESVDYYRGTMVLRDDVSGNYVTTVMRNGQLNQLRPGQYVVLSGDWTRGGLFEAYRLDDIRGEY